MSMDALFSKIILTDSFEEICEEIIQSFPKLEIHRIDAEEFLIEHAKEAIQKATLSSQKDRIIILSAHRFTQIAQNKLLKIIEEPPGKTHFILITSSKSALLPTIRSRLVIENRFGPKGHCETVPDLKNFDLAALYTLLKENRRSDSKHMAKLVENLAKEAIRSGRYRIDDALLESFSQSIRLLDMGSPPSFVLTRVGLKLLKRKC